MSQEIEHNISAYLVTITIMNALVGIATGLAMWVIGLPNPVLWGAMAFLLNYVLILGPMTGVVIFFAVGLLTFSTLWYALVPAAVYLAIHIIEGEAVTPMLVARRFTLNPVLVIGSLIFWDWMWGIPGALARRAAPRHDQDRVRPRPAADGDRAFHRRLAAPGSRHASDAFSGRWSEATRASGVRCTVAPESEAPPPA